MALQSESYDRFQCDKCLTVQMVYLGRVDDMTAPDVEVIQCGKCGHLECIEEVPWFQEKHGALDADENPLPITQELLREYGHIYVGKLS